MANQPMDDFIRDQYKAAVAVKSHAKSNALLYVKTVALQKAFGPLYRMWLNVKATMKAVVGIINPFNSGFQAINKTAKITKAVFKPILKIFNGLKIAMLFMVGTLLSFGAVMLLMAGSVSKAGDEFPIFSDNLNRIKDAAASVIERFTELYEYIQSAEFAPYADAMKSAFTDAANVISGAVATIIEILAEATIMITTLDWSPVAKTVKGIGAELAVLGGIVLALDWAGLFASASGALNGVLGLLGDVTGAISESEGGLDAFNDILQSIGDLAMTVFIGVLNAFGELVDRMREADFSGLSGVLTDVSGAVSGLATSIDNLDWSPVIDAAAAVGAELIALGVIILGLDWSGLLSAASDALNGILGLLGEVAHGAAVGVGGALDSLNQAFADLGNLVMATLIGILGVFGDLVDTIGQADFSGLAGVITTVAGAVSALAIGVGEFDWSGVSSAAVSVFAEILALINSVLTGGGAFFGAFLDTVVDVFLTLGSAWLDTYVILFDTFSQLLEIVGGLDLSPILTPAMMLFSIFAALVTDFGVGFFTLMGDMFALFSTLMAYLAETGVLQALIDIIGNLGMAAIAIIGAVVYALDEMGINFGSIFGFMSAVISGFVMFLIDSGLLAFFVEVIEVVAHILVFVGLLVAGAIALIGKLLGYLTGPTWQILSGIVGVIVGLLTGAIALVLLPFRLFFKIVSGLVKVFVALLTGGPKAAFKELGDSASDLGSIWTTTFKGVGRSLGMIWDGVIDVLMGGLKLLFSPIQFLIDAVEWLIDGLSEIADDVLDAIPGGGLAQEGYNTAKDVGKKAWGAVFGASGGVFSGPSSGYRAVLHGSEAIVPLPDGKSIPVNLTGAVDSNGIIEALNALRNDLAGADTGGDVITVNIGIEGARGNPDDIASAVSREVQKVFRTRARSGGFGRGFF